MENTNPYQSPSSELDLNATEQCYDPKIFALNGRIGRVQYILYGFAMSFVFMFILAVVVGIGTAASGGEPPILSILGGGAAYIAMIAYGFILSKRRLNDLNQTGWLSLLMLIPVVNFILALFLWFAPGDAGQNKYGLPSKKSSNGLALVAIFVIGIPVIGILAAVALPAYQSYTDRVQQSQTQ